MQARSYVDAERALLALAATQGGFFTATQAASLGYTAPKRNYHVQAGNWIREHRGIFRISTHPLPSRPDLVIWWLWSRNRQGQAQGVYSHQTALSLHEITDAMPSRIHMTVPTNFRRSAALPQGLILHAAQLTPTQVEIIDGVPATKALRTILDVAQQGSATMDDLREAFAAAVKAGRITRMEVADAESDPARRELLRLFQGRRR